MAIDDVAIRAEGYGMPGVIVDGNDPIAVYEVMRAARQRAVAGDGPTLIEAKVYRFTPHSSDDDDRCTAIATRSPRRKRAIRFRRLAGAYASLGFSTRRRIASFKRASPTRSTTELMRPMPRLTPVESDLLTHVYAENRA